MKNINKYLRDWKVLTGIAIVIFVGFAAYKSNALNKKAENLMLWIEKSPDASDWRQTIEKYAKEKGVDFQTALRENVLYVLKKEAWGFLL